LAGRITKQRVEEKKRVLNQLQEEELMEGLGDMKL
jgi:hypothetical protein